MDEIAVGKSRDKQSSNISRTTSTRSILFILAGFARSGILVASLKRLLHRQVVIPRSEDVPLQQDQLTIPPVDIPSNEEMQSAIENPSHDLASSSAAHTAQLTLISILLGVVVQALLAGLPPDFFLTLWNWRNVSLDFRVLATFLAAIDLWIKYSWGIIVIRWHFSLLHSLIYSLVSGFMIGLAMSVNNLHAWIGWGTAFCFASSLAYMQNMQSVFSEKKHREAHSHRPIASDDPPYSTKELAHLRKSSIGNALFILVPGSVGLYSTLNNYHLLPLWLQWRIPFSLNMWGVDMWGVYITFFVLVDFFVAGLVVMPKERYGQTTSSSTIYYYSDIREN